MLLLSHGRKRLEPRPHLRITRCDNGTGGFMGKSQKDHGTVENATGILDRNRERDTTLYKKRESKKQRGHITIPSNFQHPRESSEIGIQRTGRNWMIGTIQSKSRNAEESLYRATSESKNNQTENTRMGTKTRQRNVGPHNTPLALL
jgi:hypothetical protein